MGYLMARVPQAGDRVISLVPPIPGGQKAIVQRVEFYIPDFNRWAIVMAWEANARGEGVEIVATDSPSVWKQVERL